MNMWDESVAPLRFSASAEATLVDCQFEHDCIETVADLDVLPSALRMYIVEDDIGDVDADGGEPFQGAVDTFDFFVERILESARRTPVSLSVLILPSQFRAILDRSAFARRTAKRLERACATRSVEIVWEEEADWSCQSLVSPKFWRKARNMRKERSVGGQE